MIHLALIDHSTVQHNIDLDKLAYALNRQLGHVAQVGWPIYFDVHHYGTKHINRSAWPVYLLDDSDQANALGYHDVLPDGRPIGKAFIGDALRAGLEPTVTISHEVLEIGGDPYCVGAFDIGRDPQNRQWLVASELCDMVEADEDGYDVEGIRVSNFATPNWFDPNGDPSREMDWCGLLTKPLTLRPGGYASVWVEGRGWSQVFDKRQTDNVSRVKFSHRIQRRIARDKRGVKAPIAGELSTVYP